MDCPYAKYNVSKIKFFALLYKNCLKIGDTSFAFPVAVASRFWSSGSATFTRVGVDAVRPFRQRFLLGVAVFVLDRVVQLPLRRFLSHDLLSAFLRFFGFLCGQTGC
jgi:hypothetical protein